MDDLEDSQHPDDSEIISDIMEKFQEYNHIKRGIFQTFQWVLQLYDDPFTLSYVVV